MASGSISLTSSKLWRGVIQWRSTPNIAGNYTSIYVCATMWKTDGILTSSNSYTSGTITIDGVSYNLIGHQEFKNEVCIFEDTVYVDHDNDGSKSITISLTCYGQSGTSLSGYTLSGSGNAVLDTIPRSSTLTCSGGSLGSALTLDIASQSDDFTHTITYMCGNATGTVCEKTALTAVEWTPPLELAAQATTATSVSITFTLTAYSGSTAIGTDTATVKCSIPSSVVPSLSVETSDPTGYLEVYGGYIQSKSAVLANITADGVYGSTISSYQVTFDEKTYLGSQITTEAIKRSGLLQLVATVKDSRGRTASVSVDISVLTYNPPTITSLAAQRCDADGTRKASGEYLAVVFDAVVTTLNDKNSAAYILKYKKNADSIYTSVDLSDLAGQYAVTGYQYIFAASKNSSYNVVISIKDDFPAVEKSAVGPSEMTLWSIFRNGMGFAIGKVAERLGYLDMGFHIHMNGNRLHGLPVPTDSDEAVTKSYADISAYPVGSVYISVNSTSPASIFGGTWEKITDRFLLAAGSSYTAGTTGGSATHTLTVKEIASHYHDFWSETPNRGVAAGYDLYPWFQTGVDANHSQAVKSAGGSQPHNNMPPYLTVYMWKRVA